MKGTALILLFFVVSCYAYSPLGPDCKPGEMHGCYECEGTCAEPAPQCENGCNKYECQCSTGYVRSEETCIRLEDCE